MERLIEYTAYAALAAWSSLITWFVTRRGLKRESVETQKLAAESSIIEQQRAAIDNVFEQNRRIQSTLQEFQAEVTKLHKEVLELRAENTSLKFEICQLNSTIKLLTRVNLAERSFNEVPYDNA